jgi:hypothetical protein
MARDHDEILSRNNDWCQHKTRLCYFWLYDRSGQKRKKTQRLHTVYIWKAWSKKSAALINGHSHIGCNFHRKGKKGCFAAFLNARPAILKALSDLHDLGEGDEPSEDIQRGWLWSVSLLTFLSRWSPHWASKYTQMGYVQETQNQQGVDKLPPTPGAWIEYVRCVQVQSNIWRQDTVFNRTYLDPLTLGWLNIDNKNYWQYFPKLHQLRFQCCSSLDATVRNQNVREGAYVIGITYSLFTK